MKETGSYRKLWNKQQSEFRGVLLSFNQHPRAIQLFLSQHAMLHSAELAQSEPWSFEDELFSDLSAEHTRRIPPVLSIQFPGISGTLPASKTSP